MSDISFSTGQRSVTFKVFKILKSHRIFDQINQPMKGQVCSAGEKWDVKISKQERKIIRTSYKSLQTMF
jgi:hypothetical protein